MSLVADDMKTQRKAKGRCPQCGRKQKKLGVILETCELQCAYCRARFAPSDVFTDREILRRFQALPAEARETLLTKLGFEKRPAPRTRKPLFYAIAGSCIFIVLVGIIDTIRTGEDVLYCILAILGIVLYVVVHARYNGEAKSHSWHRPRGT